MLSEPRPPAAGKRMLLPLPLRGTSACPVTITCPALCLAAAPCTRTAQPLAWHACSCCCPCPPCYSPCSPQHTHAQLMPTTASACSCTSPGQVHRAAHAHTAGHEHMLLHACHPPRPPPAQTRSWGWPPCRRGWAPASPSPRPWAWPGRRAGCSCPRSGWSRWSTRLAPAPRLAQLPVGPPG